MGLLFCVSEEIDPRIRDDEEKPRKQRMRLFITRNFTAGIDFLVAKERGARIGTDTSLPISGQLSG